MIGAEVVGPGLAPLPFGLRVRIGACARLHAPLLLRLRLRVRVRVRRRPKAEPTRPDRRGLRRRTASHAGGRREESRWKYPLLLLERGTRIPRARGGR